MPLSRNLSNVNVGSSANAGDGDLVRDAFIKVNNNLNELYSSGQILAFSADGRAVPGFTWSGDRDTGFYRPAPGQIGVALNGAESLLMKEDGTLRWFSDNLATENYVLAQINNFTGGVSAANISVSVSGGTANVTVNGLPVVSSLPTTGNQQGRIVFYAGDVWIYSNYPTGNGAGLPADSSIARSAGSDSRWVRFRGDTAFSIGLVRPPTAPEGTVFYETGNAKPYFFVSGTWRTLSSVITSSAPAGLEVLVTLPLVGDPSNYAGRTVVVGNTAYIFNGGQWNLLSNYVSNVSSSGGISAGSALPASANTFELFRKTGTNSGLYIYAPGNQWQTIQQYTGNTVIARVPTLPALPSDVTNYNAGDLIIVGTTSYILNTSKTAWNFYTPGGSSGSITGIVLNAGQVGNVELAANAVLGSKIASNTITSIKLVANAITQRELADNSISSNKLQNNAITSLKIQANSLTDREIAANSISGSRLISGTIDRSKLTSNIFSGISVTANTLSEISQNAGTITSGVLRSTDGRMVIDLNNKTLRIEI